MTVLSFAAAHPLLFLGGVTLLLFLLILLRRVLGLLLRFILRTGAGLAALFACSKLGLALGVNLVNAMVIGVLGIPGLGLLFVMQRMLGT